MGRLIVLILLGAAIASAQANPQQATSEIPAPPPLPAHLYNAYQQARWEHADARANETKAYATMLLTVQGVAWLNANKEMMERTKQKDLLKDQVTAWCGTNGDFVFDARLITCIPRPRIPATPKELIGRAKAGAETIEGEQP